MTLQFGKAATMPDSTSPTFGKAATLPASLRRNFQMFRGPVETLPYKVPDSMQEAIAPVENPREDASLPTRVREIFVMFDDDNSGSLNTDELEELLKKLSSFTHDQIVAFCDDIDSSRDGSVSYGELVNWCQKGGGANGEKVAKAIFRETNKRAVRIKEAFERYDKSGDGSLDLTELTMVLKLLGAFTALEIGQVLADLDSNGDGEISFPEFADWVRRPSPQIEVTKAKCILAPSDSDGLEAVFYNFCGPGHVDLNGKSFSKLMRDSKLLNKTLTATDVDLIFADPRVKPKFLRRIDFPQFKIALQLVADKRGSSAARVLESVQQCTHPVLRGTVAQYNRFHDDVDGSKAAAANAVADAGTADGAQSPKRGELRRTRSNRIPGQLPVVKPADANAAPADNTKLWKVFGSETEAGRSLKRVYTNYSPASSFIGHIPWRAKWPPELETYVAVNAPGVEKYGIKFRRSMYLSDVCKDSQAVMPWGASIKGELVTSCWLKVGKRFLPTSLNGVHVLKRWHGPGPHPHPFDSGLSRSSSLPMLGDAESTIDLKVLPCSFTV